jgi:opacity protein-like surface antigen
MARGRIALHAILAISLGATIGQASAADPLGVYVGGAIGQSHVRADEEVFGIPLGFNEHHNAWKLLVGLRPISVIGAEVEYVDFGHPSMSRYTPILHLLATETDASAKAVAVFALAYLPLPLPLFDVYAKAGLARLHTAVNASLNFYCTIDSPCPPTPHYFRVDRTDTRFAYGAGAQIKLTAFAVRVEYERISASGGDPDLLSLGITWSF